MIPLKNRIRVVKNQTDLRQPAFCFHLNAKQKKERKIVRWGPIFRFWPIQWNSPRQLCRFITQPVIPAEFPRNFAKSRSI